MNRAVRFLRGYMRLRITGAAPERCLNLLAQAQIPFWEIRRPDELHLEFCILTKDWKNAEKLALRSFCNCERLEARGLRQLLSPLKKRPILAIGLILAVAASFFLQSFVWVIEVQGAQSVPEATILRELDALGIGFGSLAGSIDSQKTKMQMLNAIGQLSWLAVNRTGGKLTVLVSEREFASSSKQPYRAGSIIAAKDGVITDYTVLEGMRLCKRGDAVKAGQILVSGYEDYGLYLRAVCADAEIYARTWRSGTVVTPSKTAVKRYTGEEWKQVTLILGRKRINLSGNSGISADSCDKMIDVKKITLSGYTLPAVLETATYRAYELVPAQVAAAEAEDRLREAWRVQTLSDAVAGEIERTEATFSESGGLYTYRAQSDCREMIARLVPIAEPYEGAVP